VSSCLPNVLVAHPPVNVTWGTISVVEAELLCMKQLLSLNGGWKYFINLVGRDFPLRTNLELVRILKAYGGANDIGGSANGLVYGV
jgi:Core-2/I-Branching enzyme